MAVRHPVTVLVVDDSASIRRRLCDQLNAIDGVVVCGVAASGEDAVGLAARVQPELFVLDLSMPGHSGVRLVADIARRHPRSTVIVLSLDDGPSIRARCLEAGATFFLSKRSEFERVEEIAAALVTRSAAGASKGEKGG